MLSASANYNLISRDLPAALERTAKAPSVERASRDYLEGLGKIETVEDFLSNDRVYRFAMKAFGLEDMTYAKAFMRKVLTEGVADKDSFANKLSDKRYREFAETFNFQLLGKATVLLDKARQGVVDRYVRQTMEETAGQASEGTRLALYFQRKAPTIRSAFSLLADPALLKVAQTVLGLPPESGRMDIDRQAAMLAERIDIKSLQDPAELNTFLKRFLAMYDLQNAPAGMAASPVVTLFSGGNVGIDTGLLLTLQTIRSKGF